MMSKKVSDACRKHGFEYSEENVIQIYRPGDTANPVLTIYSDGKIQRYNSYSRKVLRKKDPKLLGLLESLTEVEDETELR